MARLFAQLRQADKVRQLKRKPAALSDDGLRCLGARNATVATSATNAPADFQCAASVWSGASAEQMKARASGGERGPIRLQPDLQWEPEGSTAQIQLLEIANVPHRPDE